MNVAIIGSGGREHAICCSLKQSKKIEKIYCFPGNAGTEKVATNVKIDINNFNEIKKFVKENQISFIVVGPEEPLVNGIVDYFEKENIKIFGPNKSLMSHYPETLTSSLGQTLPSYPVFLMSMGS